MNIVLKKAILSEKSMALAKGGMFTFLVSKGADKREIAKAVEEKFGVNVLNVKVANFKSKTKQQRTRKGEFVVAGFKKAIVGLKSGQKISLFELESQVKEEKVKEVKEKKSLLKGTKIKVEKTNTETTKKRK